MVDSMSGNNQHQIAGSAIKSYLVHHLIVARSRDARVSSKPSCGENIIAQRPSPDVRFPLIADIPGLLAHPRLRNG